jgi:hypothetical protein
MGLPGCLADRPPPNGKTLALLCLKLVKHREMVKIRQKSRKPLETLRKIPPVGGSGASFREIR